MKLQNIQSARANARGQSARTNARRQPARANARPRPSSYIGALATIAALIGAQAARAQSSFPEIEPNSTKAEATVASCMLPGDFLSGTTIGTDMTPGSTIVTTVDTFHIHACMLSPGIYQNRLVISSTTPGHTGTLRGVDQSGQPGMGGMPGVNDVAVQTSSPATSPPRSNMWYSFGKGEELYYRIAGTPTTTAPYKVTYSRTPITPTLVSTTFNAGTITISSVGTTNVNTDLVVVDQTFTILNGFSNDDTYPNPTFQSTLTRSFPSGSYFVGITSFDLAQRSPAPPDDNNPFGNLLDFPNVVVGSSTVVGANLAFTISDGVHTVNVPASTSLAYEIAWVQFNVGNVPPMPYCFGDGSTTACPCTNGAAGNGCPNSINAAGGHLDATGSASLMNDTLTLSATGMTHSTALYFQGTTQVHNVLGDGLLCAAGSVLRLGVKSNGPSGQSFYPGAGDPSISVKGQVHNAGDTRDYQVYYRDPASFCTSDTFNLTNGVQVTWGP
jgi:hypothetical protein